MTPGATGGGQSGGYSGSVGSCGYVQSKVSQEPRYDNGVRKRRKKKKHAK